MNAHHDQVYDFVYRAMLTEEALDAAGRVRRIEFNETEVAEALSFELFDEDLLRQARLMSTVYTAVAAFEMSVRRFVKKVLMDTYEEDWWEKGVSAKIRKFAEDRGAEEEKIKWHGVRGDDGAYPRIMDTLIQPRAGGSENLFHGPQELLSGVQEAGGRSVRVHSRRDAEGHRC